MSAPATPTPVVAPLVRLDRFQARSPSAPRRRSRAESGEVQAGDAAALHPHAPLAAALAPAADPRVGRASGAGDGTEMATAVPSASRRRNRADIGETQAGDVAALRPHAPLAAALAPAVDPRIGRASGAVKHEFAAAAVKHEFAAHAVKHEWAADAVKHESAAHAVKHEWAADAMPVTSVQCAPAPALPTVMQAAEREQLAPTAEAIAVHVAPFSVAAVVAAADRHLRARGHNVSAAGAATDSGTADAALVEAPPARHHQARAQQRPATDVAPAASAELAAGAQPPPRVPAPVPAAAPAGASAPRVVIDATAAVIGRFFGAAAADHVAACPPADMDAAAAALVAGSALDAAERRHQRRNSGAARSEVVGDAIADLRAYRLRWETAQGAAPDAPRRRVRGEEGSAGMDADDAPVPRLVRAAIRLLIAERVRCMALEAEPIHPAPNLPLRTHLWRAFSNAFFGDLWELA